MPTRLAYLWRWFLELKKPITYTEIEAWTRLTKREIERWEIRALMRLGTVLDEALR